MPTTPPPDTKVQSETPEQIAERCVREWVEHDMGEVYESGYDFMITVPPQNLIERFISALRNERERCAQVADAVENKWVDDARNVARADDLVGSLAQSTYINYAEIANDIAKAIRKGR